MLLQQHNMLLQQHNMVRLIKKSSIIEFRGGVSKAFKFFLVDGGHKLGVSRGQYGWLEGEVIVKVTAVPSPLLWGKYKRSKCMTIIVRIEVKVHDIRDCTYVKVHDIRECN